MKTKLADDTYVTVVNPKRAEYNSKGYAFQSGRKYRVLRPEGGVLGWFSRCELKRTPDE